MEEAKKRFVKLERPSKVEEISGKGIRAQMKLGEVLCGNRTLFKMHHVNVQMMESNVYGTEVFVAIKWRAGRISCHCREHFERRFR